MNLHNFWNKYEFSVNQTLLFKAGFLEVFVKHINNGWQIRSRNVNVPYPELQFEEVDGFDDESDIFSFQTGKSHELYVMPAMPNKAVVFRNNKNIRISAGESANLFFRIPLTFQLYFQEIKDENRLFEAPLQRLSDTWFGEPDNGEPAYSIGSNYDLEFEKVERCSWEAITPVEIVNDTATVFELQRLILRVEEFSLYLKNNQLLSNQVSIGFSGPEHDGSVNLSVKKALHGSKPVLLVKPRAGGEKNLLRKSFYFIKNIYQS
jgi:hypothetical protein